MERLYGKVYAEAQSRKVPSSLIKAVDGFLPIQPEDRVLEIGSGNGFLLNRLQSQTFYGFGIDINHFTANTPGAIKADAQLMPFRDATFDKVLSIHTLEHIEDLNQVFREIDRVLKPGGKSFHLFPANYLTKAEGAIFDAIRMHRLNLVKAWTDSHKIHIHKLSPGRITEFAQGTDLGITKAKRFFVPEGFSVSWGVLMEKPM